MFDGDLELPIVRYLSGSKDAQYVSSEGGASNDLVENFDFKEQCVSGWIFLQ
jgi:hypothetical protein